MFSDQAEGQAAQSAGSACGHCLRTWPLPSAEQYLSSARASPGPGLVAGPAQWGLRGREDTLEFPALCSLLDRLFGNFQMMQSEAGELSLDPQVVALKAAGIQLVSN